MTPIAMYAALPAALIVASSAAGMDMAPTAILYTIFLGGDFLFLPYESTNYLVMFSFGIMTMKDFIYTHTVRTIGVILWLVVIMYPYWSMVGIL